MMAVNNTNKSDAVKNKNKSEWYDKFLKGLETLNNESLSVIIKNIEEAEGNETQEKIDETSQLIKALTLSEEEQQIVYEYFTENGKEKVKEPLDFVVKKFERKLRLQQNRVKRTIPSSFGSYVALLREEQKLTLKDVERLTGISPSYINRIEKGERKAPSFPILEKLADAFKVDTSEFLKILNVDTDSKGSGVESFAQVIFSNAFTVNGNFATKQQKEFIVEFITKIDGLQWDNNSKYRESIELMELINNYKEISTESK